MRLLRPEGVTVKAAEGPPLIFGGVRHAEGGAGQAGKPVLRRRELIFLVLSGTLSGICGTLAARRKGAGTKASRQSGSCKAGSGRDVSYKRARGNNG
jgi:hypothetical protein